MMVLTPRPNPRIRNTPREWTVIIASAIILHAVFLLFFKPQYLEILRTQAPQGEEGDERFPFLDNPFHVIPLASESRSAAAVVEPSDDAESSVLAPDELVIGEPQMELSPLQRGGGGGEGRKKPGPRKATVEPKPLFIPWPKYPRGVKEIAEGNVELSLLVNEKGEVEDVRITRKLPLAELNRIAVEAARKIRFTPGMENGVRAAMWVRLAIGFQPR